MSQHKHYPVSTPIADRALITAERYRQLYQQSIDDPDSFWRQKGRIVD
ncbi:MULTISPECIES: hypothetical protein [Lonsdalea]